MEFKSNSIRKLTTTQHFYLTTSLLQPNNAHLLQTTWTQQHKHTKTPLAQHFLHLLLFYHATWNRRKQRSFSCCSLNSFIADVTQETSRFGLCVNSCFHLGFCIEPSTFSCFSLNAYIADVTRKRPASDAFTIHASIPDVA